MRNKKEYNFLLLKVKKGSQSHLFAYTLFRIHAKKYDHDRLNISKSGHNHGHKSYKKLLLNRSNARQFLAFDGLEQGTATSGDVAHLVS